MKRYALCVALTLLSACKSNRRIDSPNSGSEVEPGKLQLEAQRCLNEVSEQLLKVNTPLEADVISNEAVLRLGDWSIVGIEVGKGTVVAALNPIEGHKPGQYYSYSICRDADCSSNSVKGFMRGYLLFPRLKDASPVNVEVRLCQDDEQSLQPVCSVAQVKNSIWPESTGLKATTAAYDAIYSAQVTISDAAFDLWQKSCRFVRSGFVPANDLQRSYMEGAKNLCAAKSALIAALFSREFKDFQKMANATTGSAEDRQGTPNCQKASLSLAGNEAAPQKQIDQEQRALGHRELYAGFGVLVVGLTVGIFGGYYRDYGWKGVFPFVVGEVTRRAGVYGGMALAEAGGFGTGGRIVAGMIGGVAAEGVATNAASKAVQSVDKRRMEQRIKDARRGATIEKVGFLGAMAGAALIFVGLVTSATALTSDSFSLFQGQVADIEARVSAALSSREAAFATLK